MNINPNLSIGHFSLGLLLLTAAVLIFLTSRKSAINQIIGGVLTVSAATEIASALQMNSLTPQQALPWASLHLLSDYALSITFILLTLILFLPKYANHPAVRVGGAALILVPLILLIFDLVGLSIPVVGTYFVVNVSRYGSLYTPGHIGFYPTAFGTIYFILNSVHENGYLVLLLFLLLFVIIRGRRTEAQNRQIALLLILYYVIAISTSYFLEDMLPTTVPHLITTVVLGLVLGSVYLLNSGLKFENILSLDIFRNIPMLYKILLVVTGIVLPSIIFMSFAIYSLLFNNTLENTTAYLRDFAITQAEEISSETYQAVQNVGVATQAGAIQDLIAEANEIYQGLSESEIQQHLSYLEDVQEFVPFPSISQNNQPLFTSLLRDNPMLKNLTLVDIQGGLIGSSGEPTEFDLSDIPWWLHVSTERANYIGTPTWNQELDTHVVSIAVPIINLRGEFIGAAEASYSLEDILTSLAERLNLNLSFGLNVLNQTLIPVENLQQADLTLPDRMNAPQTMAQGWTVVRLNNDDSFLTSTKLDIAGIREDLSFELAAYQSFDTALATLYTIRNRMLTLMGVIMAIVIVTSFIMARGISNPIVALNDAAKQVLDGDLNVEISVTGEDELGVLGTTFSQMTSQLAGMLNTLESTVEERTKDLERRNLQMETSARVARQAAEIRDLQTLLNQSVHLITDQFGYYHTGIFLLDSTGRYAVLQAASSEGGQRMLARGHRLQVGKVGVVGYSAGTGNPRISQDVGADIVYYDNPDMPRTRSEMALPLRVRDTVIGVLDVQSTEASAFAQEDVEILQTMADQIALAIDNVRLLQSSQRALDELQRLYGQQAGLAWRQRLTGQQVNYHLTPTGIEPVGEEALSEIENKPGHRLRKEIKFRGQTIGNLNLLRESGESNWSEEEQALIDEILEQTALALENARLVDQIRLRSDQIQLLQEVSSISSEILDEERLIPILADKLQASLDVEHCGVVLLHQGIATLTVSAGQTDNKPHLGVSIQADTEPITQRLIRNKEVDIFIRVQDDPRLQTFLQSFSTLLPQTLIFLPIIVRDQTVGFFYLEDIKSDRDVDSEEFNLFNQLTTQISTAMENIRLFEETSNRAERERQVAEITAKIRSSNDPQEILEVAVAELKKALKPKTDGNKEDAQTPIPASQENGKDVI
jgi:GAF domain-containing protein/HAMP domain-containing protein